jgi:tRNA(adenine34) deaminase
MYANTDEIFMRYALDEAHTAYEHHEVPIGAVAVYNGEIIAKAYNQVEYRKDPTAHAELLVIQAAALIIKNQRLTEVDIYTTIEPCGMCAGALVLARVRRIIYGADDNKAGACGSVINLVQHPLLNHKVEVVSGILAQEATELIQRFFKERRLKR